MVQNELEKNLKKLSIVLNMLNDIKNSDKKDFLSEKNYEKIKTIKEEINLFTTWISHEKNRLYVRLAENLTLSSLEPEDKVISQYKKELLEDIKIEKYFFFKYFSIFLQKINNIIVNEITLEKSSLLVKNFKDKKYILKIYKENKEIQCTTSLSILKEYIDKKVVFYKKVVSTNE